MVKIIGYKSIENEDGENFFVLIVQGGVEIVKSKITGKSYFTARTVNVPATFDENTCKDLLGSNFEGEIVKVTCEPYEYTIKESGEEITIDYRYEYVDMEQEHLEENIIDREIVS